MDTQHISSQLSGVAGRVRELRPELGVHVRTWGPAYDSLGNLWAYERNRREAALIAEEIAECRRKRPEATIYLAGFSGGGGMAVFVAEALPEGVQVDRLILVAAAISDDYEVRERVLPRVREFTVNYVSPLDAQLSIGTRLAGNMDGGTDGSAGHVGFDRSDPALVQIHWRPEMLFLLHFGNHLSYLSAPWQRACLMPAFERDMTAEGLCMRFKLTQPPVIEEDLDTVHETSEPAPRTVLLGG
jgi:pimeloyl-ACP methyl ester carboxylesterase